MPVTWGGLPRRMRTKRKLWMPSVVQCQWRMFLMVTSVATAADLALLMIPGFVVASWLVDFSVATSAMQSQLFLTGLQSLMNLALTRFLTLIAELPIATSILSLVEDCPVKWICPLWFKSVLAKRRNYDCYASSLVPECLNRLSPTVFIKDLKMACSLWTRMQSATDWCWTVGHQTCSIVGKVFGVVAWHQLCPCVQFTLTMTGFSSRAEKTSKTISINSVSTKSEHQGMPWRLPSMPMSFGLFLAEIHLPLAMFSMWDCPRWRWATFVQFNMHNAVTSLYVLNIRCSALTRWSPLKVPSHVVCYKLA